LEFKFVLSFEIAPLYRAEKNIIFIVDTGEQSFYNLFMIGNHSTQRILPRLFWRRFFYAPRPRMIPKVISAGGLFF